MMGVCGQRTVLGLNFTKLTPGAARGRESVWPGRPKAGWGGTGQGSPESGAELLGAANRTEPAIPRPNCPTSYQICPWSSPALT